MLTCVLRAHVKKPKNKKISQILCIQLIKNKKKLNSNALIT